MLTYGNPSRNFLPYLKTESYLDTLLPELASYPFPKNDGQDVIDRFEYDILEDELVNDDDENSKLLAVTLELEKEFTNGSGNN